MKKKKVFFFTSINGPFLTDDDVIHAISEKIEDMALKVLSDTDTKMWLCNSFA